MTNRMPPEAVYALERYKAVIALGERIAAGRNGTATPQAVIATEPLVASAGVPRLWTPLELAQHDFHAPLYFVDEIAAPSATTIAYGAREAGKTQLLLTLARAIQEESLFLGRFQARRCRIALCQFDMPPKAFQERLQRAMERFSFDADVLRIITGDGSTVDTLSATTKDRWVAELNEWKPDLVMFDSLRKTHHKNENDTGVPSEVYGKWRKLFPGAGYLASHHVSKKPSKFEQRKKGSSVYRAAEEPEAYRGTTAWLDDADYGVMLSVDNQRRIVQLTRGRTLSEETKSQLIPVRLDEEYGLFLVPVDPTPMERLKQFRLDHPKRSKAEAVEWVAQEYKGRNKATYYRWAKSAGYPEG
jgi:hypothetical protein